MVGWHRPHYFVLRVADHHLSSAYGLHDNRSVATGKSAMATHISVLSSFDICHRPAERGGFRWSGQDPAALPDEIGPRDGVNAAR